MNTKDLKDYTIGAAIEICSEADNLCWLHRKHPDYPGADHMERCPFYNVHARSGKESCRINNTHEPAYWDVQAKPIGEYTLNEIQKKCYIRTRPCDTDCQFKAVCEKMGLTAPSEWDI